MKRNAAIIAIAASLGVSACAVKTDGRCELDVDCAVGARCIDKLCSGGAVPVASFTGPEEVDLAALVSLDGSASARDDGSKDGLAYEWKLLSPQGAEFEGPSDGATVKLRAAVPHGTYKVQLITRDRGTPSAPAVRDIKVRNSKPVASLSVEPTVWTRNTELTFDASASSDPDGDALTYEWTLVKDPANVPGTLVPGAAGTATLMTADVAAKYTVKVVVSDGHGGSDDETLEQTLGNAPPTLDPGQASTVAHACTAVTCSATFTLTGTATDVDGTINDDSVAWTLKSSPPAAQAGVVFQPVVKAGSTFSAEAKLSNELPLPLVGDYVFQLEAKDNDGDRSTATVTITVGNEAPTIAFDVAASPLEVNHSFDDGKFIATVLPSVLVTDAESNKLTVEFLDVVTSLPGATVERAAGASETTAAYTISVDLANPTSLIDGTTPLYEIKAKVTDHNGASSEATLPVLILNREPVLTGYFGGATQTTVGHNYASGKYTQPFAVSGLTITDPDNDPLDIVWAHAGGPADTQLVAGGGGLVPATLTLSSADKALVNADVTATATVSDAFGGTVSGSKTLKMGNRLPTLVGLPTGTNGPGHSYGLPTGVAGTTKGYWHAWNMTLVLADADNDPEVAITSWEAATAGVANGAIQKLTVGGGLPTGITLFSTEAGIVNNDITLMANLTDGIGTTAATSEVKMLNRPPTVSVLKNGNTTANHSVYSCNAERAACASGCSSPPVFCLGAANVTHWGSGTSGAYSHALKANLVDPDGDPLTAAWNASAQNCDRGGTDPCQSVGNSFLDSNGAALNPSVSCVAGVDCALPSTYKIGTQKVCAGGTDYGHFVLRKETTVTVTPSDGFDNGTAKSLKITPVNGAAPGGPPCMIVVDPGETG